MSDSLFLRAFDGTNERIPVWFMRQAGRYLPEYQKYKEKYSLDEMFANPELAAEITCLPIPILNVDAAIMFADILTLPKAMGFDIHFSTKSGPQVTPMSNLNNVHDIDGIDHITQIILKTNEMLPSHIPLIGFAGSPFTVATYLIEGGSSVNFHKTFRFMKENPSAFQELMMKLTKNTIEYYKIQKQAGIKAFQLFDSWGGILPASEFETFVLPYVYEIFQRVDLPSIYYVKNCRHLLSLIDQSHADFLSVDHTVVLGEKELLKTSDKGFQGNLFNGLLYADDEIIRQEVNKVLEGGSKHSKYIFNLSHGVFLDVNPDKLKFIVDLVHNYSPK